MLDRPAPADSVLPTARPDAESVLHRLAAMPDARYEELLVVPAEHVLRVLGATSVSFSRWERERGVLRCVVNVGHLGAGQQRFPGHEEYLLAEMEEVAHLVEGHGRGYALVDPDLSVAARDLLGAAGAGAAVSVPLYVEDRLWGELWATQRGDRLPPASVDRARAVAAEVSGMVALAERLQQMARLAFFDPLTGLGNRRLMDDTLVQLLGPDGAGATVVICDVNDLKTVNDERGHEAGDRVIVAVADALAAAAGATPGGVAVRLGGDEFAILLPGAARAAAIDAVESAAHRLDELADRVRVSCGVAVVPAGTSPRDTLAVADAAQYAAKRRRALLVITSDVEPPPPVPSRGQVADRRSTGRAVARSDDNLEAVCAEAVCAVAESLEEVPATVRAQLGWLAERLLAPFALDRWTLSHVALNGDRALRVTAMGMRGGPPRQLPGRNLLVDSAFELADYPLSQQAVLGWRWFCIDAEDERADPGEREVLRGLGMRFLLALGCTDGDDGWLLELYANDAEVDCRLLGSTLALAASAVLRRPVLQVRIGP